MAVAPCFQEETVSLPDGPVVRSVDNFAADSSNPRVLLPKKIATIGDCLTAKGGDWAWYRGREQTPPGDLSGALDPGQAHRRRSQKMARAINTLRMAQSGYQQTSQQKLWKSRPRADA